MINVTSNMQSHIDGLVQRPTFKLLSYDISQATGETWGSIINGTASQTPFDLSSVVSKIAWSYDRLQVTLIDDTQQFHPDGGVNKSVLKPGRGIRLLEGFEGVPEDEWIVTFSGIIQGPYSWQRERGTSFLTSFSVFTRDANQAWRRRSITSKEFTIGTDWSVMFYQVAQEVMGLDFNEIVVEEPWNLLFDKTVNQIVNISPWEGLSALAEGNLSRIWFNGNGQLAAYPISLDRVNLVLSDDKLLSSYQQPGNNQEVVNKVIVTYIDNQLTKVTGAKKSLGTANVTTGFFDFETRLDVFWSEDKKQRAENVELVVKNSINQNDLGISIGSERLEIANEYGGQLIITVDEFVSALAVAGLASILDSAFEADAVQVGISGTGVTIPVGKLHMGLGVIAVLLAMMILGTGIYEIFGNPYEYAYLEKQAIAMLDNIPFWEEKEKNIRNDFISTEEKAHQLALTELLFAQSQGQPRNFVIANDPRIEKGDIIQLANGVKIFVDTAQRTIVRGQPIPMSISGFKSVV